MSIQIAKAGAAADGFIYCVVHHERQAVKIGYSADPKRRLKELQTGSSDLFTLFGSVEGGRIQEAAFHRVWADRRLRGEWFDDRDHQIRDMFGRMAWRERMDA